MSVYKPKNSPHFHYDFVAKGRRFYGSTYVSAKRAAEGVERAKRIEAAEGRLDDAAQLTLDDAAGRWWAEHGRHKASAKDIERRLDVAIKLIGPRVRLCEITTQRVSAAIERRRGQAFTRSAKKGAKAYLPSNSTVNRDLIDTTLRPILRRAVRLWGARGLPAIDWGALRLEQPKAKAIEFSDGEFASINAAVMPHWHDFIAFSAKYGCRLGEMFFPLAALDLENREEARVTLRDRKGGDDHIIPLTPEDAAMFAARAGRARAAKLDTVWFRETKSGKLLALTYSGAESAVRRAMTVTGLRASKGARGPHSLRHNGGMKMLRATGNLRLTQKLLGHASIQSTLVYAHAMEADLRAGLAALSRHSPEQAKTESEETSPDQDVKSA